MGQYVTEIQLFENLLLSKWNPWQCILTQQLFRYIYGRTFTKESSCNMIFTWYPNGFWHKRNIDVLGQMCCWLLLQIYRCTYDCFCSPGSHTITNTSLLTCHILIWCMFMFTCSSDVYKTNHSSCLEWDACILHSIYVGYGLLNSVYNSAVCSIQW